MTKGLFITGTDTDCGKTEITLGLMQALQQRGERVLGMKPVASGAEETTEGLRNEDALRIRMQGGSELPYTWINPFAYAPPIAPHLAAESSGRPIELQLIADLFERLTARAERVLVEGVGGWQVPLTGEATVADLALRLELPVVLVVGMRLGCINHALLTDASIRQSGARLLGWVANQVDPRMASFEGNLRTLRERLSAPCLGVVPWLERPSPAAVGEYLNLPHL
ncbi:MAG: dethiobiotin synthase [Chromatiales bacterium]|jgi:dethiobiotin synthetase